MTRTRYHAWTDAEDEFLRGFIPGHGEQEVLDEFSRRFGWTPTLSQMANRRGKLGVRHGTKGGCFEPGHVPLNKGKRQEDFMSADAIERTKATRFKKGHMPHNAREGLGHERRDKDGRMMVKVREHNEPGKPNTYELKSRVMWARYHGVDMPPKDCMVVMANHDIDDFSEENLVLVPKRLWATVRVLSCKLGVEYYDRESLEAVIAMAEVSQARRKAERRLKDGN